MLHYDDSKSVMTCFFESYLITARQKPVLKIMFFDNVVSWLGTTLDTLMSLCPSTEIILNYLNENGEHTEGLASVIHLLKVYYLKLILF